MAIAVDFMAASEWGWLDDWPEVDTSILRDLSFIGGEARFGALPCIWERDFSPNHCESRDSLHLSPCGPPSVRIGCLLGSLLAATRVEP